MVRASTHGGRISYGMYRTLVLGQGLCLTRDNDGRSATTVAASNKSMAIAYGLGGGAGSGDGRLDASCVWV
jgi:hypothetical protein